MSALSARAAEFAIRGRALVRDISLELSSGDMLALVGPNGSGKSTLLRLLAGILAPTRGEVHLHGEPLSKLGRSRIARSLAYLPQDTWTDFALTAEDTVAMGRYSHQRRWRGPSLEDLSAVRRSMERLGVDHLKDRTLPTLSGGERQRVFLARALAQGAPILILDEPTTALDVGHQLELMDLLRELHAEGRTLVAAIHDLHLVWRFFPRAVLLRDGTVVEDGATSTVLLGEETQRTFGIDLSTTPDGQGLHAVRRVAR